MIEKRFIFHGTEIEDTLETDVDYKYTSCNKDGFQDLCELLNELHEENEQLRKKNKELKKSIGEYVRINKENELLFEINNGLGKENEQLKNYIKNNFIGSV